MRVKMEKHNHDYISNDENISKNRKKTILVVIITATMLVIEIAAGYITGSMALLADGWHMATHAGALLISVFTYNLAQSKQINEKLSFGGGKFIPLGGYTSAIALAIVALMMCFEAVQRLFDPTQIHYKEAIVVTIIGLIVNVSCAFILMNKTQSHFQSTANHSHHHHHDHNLRSAYIHVISDALTSVFALIALITGMFFNVVWLDPIMAIISSFVIMRWAYNLCHDTSLELLDHQFSKEKTKKINEWVEKRGGIIQDLHVWRVAPNALNCAMSISHTTRIQLADFKQYLRTEFNIRHSTIEIYT